jgi:hypothetical protein
VAIKTGSCQAIAEETIEYAFFVNTKLLPYLHDFAYVMASFSLSGVEKPAQVKNFRRIKKATQSCATALQAGKGAKRCRNYCQHYKFNANAPVIEGYAMFYNEVLN